MKNIRIDKRKVIRGLESSLFPDSPPTLLRDAIVKVVLDNYEIEKKCGA